MSHILATMSDKYESALFSTFGKLNSWLDRCGHYGVDAKIVVPNVAIVGAQGVGKSTLVDAFVGYRFNYTQQGLGTLRPLHFFLERSDTVTQPVWYFKDPLTYQEYKEATPESIAATLTSINQNLRREVRLEKTPFYVMCVRNCGARLNIIDLPGLRTTEYKPDESRAIPRKKFREVVKEHALKPGAIILGLENSSIESAASITHGFMQDYKDLIERNGISVIRVATKLNQRSANNIDMVEDERRTMTQLGCQFFAVSVPSADLRFGESLERHITEVDTEDRNRFTALLPCVKLGFENLSRSVHIQLLKEYIEALSTVISQVDDLVTRLKIEMDTLDDMGIGKAREHVSVTCQAVVKRFHELLEGLGCKVVAERSVDLKGQREMLVDKRDALWEELSLEQDAPVTFDKYFQVSSEVKKIPFNKHKISGGGLYRRLLEEFRQECLQPTEICVTKDAAANALNSILSDYVLQKVWEGTVNKLLKEQLAPVFDRPLEVLCNSLLLLMHEFVDITLESLNDGDQEPMYSTAGEFLSKHRQFRDQLQRAMIEYGQRLIATTGKEVKSLCNALVQAVSVREQSESSLQRYKCVEDALDGKNGPAIRKKWHEPSGKSMTDDAFAWVLRIMDEYMEFKKQSAVAVLQTACEAYFKIPLFTQLSMSMAQRFSNMTDGEVEQLFGINPEEMRRTRNDLHALITCGEDILKELIQLRGHYPAD